MNNVPCTHYQQLLVWNTTKIEFDSQYNNQDYLRSEIRPATFLQGSHSLKTEKLLSAHNLALCLLVGNILYLA